MNWDDYAKWGQGKSTIDNDNEGLCYPRQSSGPKVIGFPFNQFDTTEDDIMLTETAIAEVWDEIR